MIRKKKHKRNHLPLNQNGNKYIHHRSQNSKFLTKSDYYYYANLYKTPDI